MIVSPHLHSVKVFADSNTHPLEIDRRITRPSARDGCQMTASYFTVGTGERRPAAVEAASQNGSCPAGGSFTTRADRTPGHARTAATASGEGS